MVLVLVLSLSLVPAAFAAAGSIPLSRYDSSWTDVALHAIIPKASVAVRDGVVTACEILPFAG